MKKSSDASDSTYHIVHLHRHVSAAHCNTCIIMQDAAFHDIARTVLCTIRHGMQDLAFRWDHMNCSTDMGVSTEQTCQYSSTTDSPKNYRPKTIGCYNNPSLHYMRCAQCCMTQHAPYCMIWQMLPTTREPRWHLHWSNCRP